MNEPQEIGEYLAQVGGALRGTRNYRREIIDELHAHLLDEIENASGGNADVAKKAIQRFGSARVIASGFNDLRREKHVRLLRLALAFCVVSMAGGLAVQRSLVRADHQSSPSVALARSTIEMLPGAPNSFALDPRTGKVIAAFRRAKA